MERDLVQGDMSEILRTILSETSEDLIITQPTENAIEELVEVMNAMETPPRVRLLGKKRKISHVMEDFLVASAAAELIEEGVLELRSGGEQTSPVISTDDWVGAMLLTPDVSGVIVGGTDEIASKIYESHLEAWEQGEEYTLRTPPISRVRDSLGEDISPDAEGDFSEAVESLDTARGDGDLDEVEISILVGAKNETLFYDLSRWGEDVGLASKATFSRVKNRLEDRGLIKTEKVPIDVGRPRQRLTLADERLQEAQPDQLVTVAESTLT